MFADSGCPIPDGVWQVLQGLTASPLPPSTLFNAPAWPAGGATAAPPPPPAGGAGAFGSGAMKAQPGPGASAAIAAIGNKTPASSHAYFFMRPSRSAPASADTTTRKIIANAAWQQGENVIPWRLPTRLAVLDKQHEKPARSGRKRLVSWFRNSPGA